MTARRAASTALVLALLTAGCTTPLFYSVGPPQPTGAWTQAPGASPAAGWGPPQSQWPETAGAPGAYQATSLQQQAWGSELAAQSQPGHGVKGAPQGTADTEAWGEMPRISFSGRAEPVAPGSTGAGTFGSGPVPQDPLVSEGDVARHAPDTGVLQADEPGTVGAIDAGTRAIQTDGSGRPFLFELYQQARDERDALRTENESLLALLTAREAEIQSLKDGALGEGAELEALRAERDGLRAEIERLAEERQELEGRLLTAQIRRLEAEKGLIEEWIQNELSDAAAGLETEAGALTPPR